MTVHIESNAPPHSSGERRPLGQGFVAHDPSVFQELWHYRQLFYFLVWRDVKVRYRQTVLGAAWAVIQPLFTMVVFTLLFGRLAKIPNEGVPYPLFYYSALVPWVYFANSLTNSGMSLVSNKNLITKVYFPRIMVPASAVLAGLLDFAIASLLLGVLLWYYGLGASWELLFWPVLVLPLVLLGLGIGFLLSALNVNYRDIKYTTPFLVQLWLFSSPIAYPMSAVPEKYRVFMAVNPVAGITEAFRAAVVPERTIEWTSFAVSFASTIAVLVLGYWYFKRTEREFADVI